jgi:Bacterial PH domain
MNPQNEIIIEEVKSDSSEEKELKKYLKLLNGETIEFKSKIFNFSRQLVKQNRGVVLLSNQRLIFLLHHALGSEQLMYIPFVKITKASFSSRKGLRSGRKAIEITYDDDRSINFEIAVFLGRTSNKETSDLFEKLKKKLPRQIISG